MAFNFTPLEYNPFEYSNNQGSAPRYDQYDGVWRNVPAQQPAEQHVQDYERRGLQSQMNQQRDYSGNQFQSLFDSVNNIGTNPLVSGSAYNNTPQYSPYQGTRLDYTSPVTKSRQVWDNDANMQGGGYVPQSYQEDVFNQRGYLDAQFNNINDYLGKMGSFFGNMGNGQDAQTQALLANMQGQGPRPVMPSVGVSSNLGMTPGGTSGNNPFQSFGAIQSGGWGTAPTSLFGAGAGNANNT